MALITLWILLAAAIYLTAQLATAIFASRRPPPGFRHVPVAGTAAQLGPYPQQKLRQWALEHRELFRAPLGREQWIYVNSPAAVKEIFDKQPQHSSSRAPSPVVLDLVSGGMRFPLMPYSPYWRKLRAIVHKLPTPKSSDTFMPSQGFEAKQLLWDMLTDNENQGNFYMHIVDILPRDCEDIREIYDLMEEFSKAATPGKYIAESLLVLAKLPAWMEWWRKEALQAFNRQATIWMKYWTGLRTQMDLGQEPECFVKEFIETDYKKNDIDEIQASFGKKKNFR